MMPMDFFVPVGPGDGERIALMVRSWRRHVAIVGHLYLVYHPAVESKVRLLRLAHGPSVCPVPEFALVADHYAAQEWDRVVGWNRQQFLKLLSHTLVRTEWYCICDATTLFVRNLTVADLTDGQRFVMPFVDSRSNDCLWFDEPVIHSTNQALGVGVCRDSYIAEFAVWNTKLLAAFWRWACARLTIRQYFDRLDRLPRKTLSEWCLYGSYCRHILGASLYTYRREERRDAFSTHYLSIENLDHAFYRSSYDFPDDCKIVSLQRRNQSGYLLDDRQRALLEHYLGLPSESR